MVRGDVCYNRVERRLDALGMKGTGKVVGGDWGRREVGRHVLK